MPTTATDNAPLTRLETLSVFVPAAVVLVAVVGTAFAGEWLIGRIPL